MLVKDYMTRHPILIEPSRRITDAQRMMIENKVRHLPVVGDGKRLLGLITRQRLSIPPDRLGSLNVWEITRYLADLTVEQAMLKQADVRIISPEATLEDAAEIMCRHKIGGLPVVDDGIVVGIITETDLLVELQNLLGANEPGWRVTMRVPDRRGEFSKLTRAILEKGCGVMSLGSGRSPKASEYWDVVLKVRGCTEDELRSVLEGIEDQELLDLRETSVFSM